MIVQDLNKILPKSILSEIDEVHIYQNLNNVFLSADLVTKVRSLNIHEAEYIKLRKDPAQKKVFLGSLAHEIGHFVSVPRSDISKLSGSCTTHDSPCKDYVYEGSHFGVNTVMGLFYFIYYYQQKEDNSKRDHFITNYARTNPLEDAAETIGYIISPDSWKIKVKAFGDVATPELPFPSLKISNFRDTSFYNNSGLRQIVSEFQANENKLPDSVKFEASK